MRDPFTDDWQLPEYARVEKAWSEHPQHELLAQLGEERGTDGQVAWEIVKMADPDHPEWTVVHLRPIDSFDRRSPVRITTYPRKLADVQVSDVPAIAEEADG